MSTAAQNPDILTEPTPDGGIDLFRRSPRGFVLVDTFDTDASVRGYIATLRASRRRPTASGNRRAMPVHPAAL